MMWISLLAATLIASAGSPIHVSDAHSRPAVDMGAVFLSIVNSGSADDQLDQARSDLADATEVHETYAMAGGEGMRHVPFVKIPSGRTVVLKSGGYHIMLIGLKHGLHVGDKFTIGLHFKSAGWIDVPVVVQDF